MTNRERLKAPEPLLSELDKQRLFLLRTEGAPRPCPACQATVNLFEAAGIDLDAYDFGTIKHDYRCPACAARLEQVVPLFPGGGQPWYWALEAAWLQEQLRKAKAFDQQHPAGQNPATP